MRVSHRWLCELLPGLDLAPDELAERLTRAGLEAESVTRFGEGLERVVVAEVKKIEPHPKRDKIRLVTVDRGGEQMRVVCGAANVPQPGGLVALAPLGTHLPAAGLTLTAREIAGVVSEGMLCSEAELGLAEASEGILVLPAGTATPGTPLTEALPGASDVIFDLGITPNRPDALGHVGVARDVAALLGLSLQAPPRGEPRRRSTASLSDLVQVENRDVERCPHYGAAAVLNVRLGPSPAWLRWRLQSLGIRPISNVVDITNLILLEYGQPMHAFDLDRVRGGRIIVRRASAGEAFTTLDGVARQLEEDDLVIADAEGPCALAGVMGGADSEIRETTTRVLLECAYFTPRGVRRSGRRHALHTESSFRFERGVDYGAIPHVLARAQNLLCELASGEAVEGAIHDAGPLPVRPTITLRASRLRRLTGDDVDFGEATSILSRLGLEVGAVEGDGDAASCEVRGASFRPDISMEADLIEEVARIRGLDRIPTLLPAIPPQPPRASGRLEREAGQHAVALGLSEAVTYAFVSPRELTAFSAPAPSVTLKNPLSEERSVMRTSLLPGLCESVKRARRHGERSVRLFGLGSVFLSPRGDAGSPSRPRASGDAQLLPFERSMFSAVLAGPRPSYLGEGGVVDVHDAKGLCVELCERLAGRTPSIESAAGADDARHLHPRGAARVMLGGARVGLLGPLHPDVVDALDLGGPLMVVELDLSALELVGRLAPKYRPIPRLPAVVRDISLEVSEDVAAGELTRLISENAGELCESVTLFDLYHGDKLERDHRSLTFRIVYRDPRASSDPDNARTLTDKEVDQITQRVLQAAQHSMGARLRG